LNGADVIVIPGSKNTISDLLYLRKSGMEKKIKEFAGAGGMVAGICGGYQMLGMRISDPHRVDGPVGEAEGMGLLPVLTVMEKEKQTVQTAAKSLGTDFWEGDLDVRGYEIHMGTTERLEGTKPAFSVGDSDRGFRFDGAAAAGHRVWGTYLHGVFDSDGFRKSFLNNLRTHKGTGPSHTGSYELLKQEGFDKLADIVRTSLDMGKIYALINGKISRRSEG
jgi:adenosylcobyric acid synthase